MYAECLAMYYFLKQNVKKKKMDLSLPSIVLCT